MTKVNVCFSDFFNIDKDVMEESGVLDISLINDLPLFIDPFLLFNSEEHEFQSLHKDIILYLKFLHTKAIEHPILSENMMKSWYLFPEVRQNWLGFSRSGNNGRGLNREFGANLHDGLKNIFSNFGEETITQSPHLEKLCLISSNVGRDKISDFTTNLIKKYLLKFTEKFAYEYLNEDQCKIVNINHVEFNYKTMSWMSQTFKLPFINNDYVILTPKSILSRDKTFINKDDMINNLERIAPSIEDGALRFQLSNYLTDILKNDKHKISKEEKEEKTIALIKKYPELIDFYIKDKEINGYEATSINKETVQEVQQLFNVQLKELVNLLNENTEFYETATDSLIEARKRVNFLKEVIEDQDGYRIFYIAGKAIKRESDLQIMYRLVWYSSVFDVNREVNNGRGPVDYKISLGAHNSALVEFKLASNSQLKRNLSNQVEIYKNANNTNKALKVIMYFTEVEYIKVQKILNELNLQDCDEIVLIDARNDNKPSASVA